MSNPYDQADSAAVDRLFETTRQPTQPTPPPTAEEISARKMFPNSFQKPAPVQHRADLSAEENASRKFYATTTRQEEAERAKLEAQKQPQPQQQPQQQKPAAARPDTPEPAQPAQQNNYDSEVVTAYHGVVAELGIDGAKAQQLFDKVAPVIESRRMEQLYEISEAWQEESRTDAEFGGDDFDDNLAVAKDMLLRYSTPKLRDLLNESGLGNHPELIRMLVRAGKAMAGED